MKVKICGPNLRDQSKGGFHVHEAFCADLKKSKEPEYDNGWEVEVTSKEEAVKSVYGDFEDYPDPAYTQDVYFFPCTKGLPV